MNVAPGINYPDPWWKVSARQTQATPPGVGSVAGVPEQIPHAGGGGGAGARNERNFLGPGIGRSQVSTNGVAGGTAQGTGIVGVQLAPLTLIQNQASG